MTIVNGVSAEHPLCIVTGKNIRVADAYESITEVRCPTTAARIKIWRSEPALPEYADEELLNIFKKIPDGAGIADLRDIFSSIDRVTAIEITDRNGLGCLVHF